MNMPMPRTVMRKESAAKKPQDIDAPSKKRVVSAIPSDDIAESKICYLNFKWIGAEKDFPQEPWLRSVSKFYPFAKDGALYIEEPSSDSDLDLKIAQNKIAKLKARGLRCLVLTKGMKREDAFMELERMRSHDVDHSQGSTEKPSVGRSNGQASLPKDSNRNTKRNKQKL